MYELYVANKKSEKLLQEIINVRSDVRPKLDRLRLNPRTEAGAHPLHGRLAGKWGSWLGSNIRMIYSIDDDTQRIIIEAVGSHNIY